MTTRSDTLRVPSGEFAKASTPREGGAALPWPRCWRPQSLRGDWVGIVAIWLGSIAMHLHVGGPGFGAHDLTLALNRGVVGLLICFHVLPNFLRPGRYTAAIILSAGLIAIFGALQLYVAGPLVQAGHVHGMHCYQCYLTATLPAVATMAAIKLSWSLLEQQKQAAIVSRERSDAEVRFLRTQMNPHLLFNSLNNVYSYALERSERAPEMILKLSGVLRYMLYEAGDEIVPLRRELDYISDYFELQRLATEGRGEVTLAISGNTARLCIAPVVLIVLIENCFKHAVETTEPVSVHVSIRVDGETLTLETENNLPASVSRSDPKRPGGIGLENVRRRLELLYHGRHDLQTWQTEDTYHARMKLTLDPA